MVEECFHRVAGSGLSYRVFVGISEGLPGVYGGAWLLYIGLWWNGTAADLSQAQIVSSSLNPSLP